MQNCKPARKSTHTRRKNHSGKKITKLLIHVHLVLSDSRKIDTLTSPKKAKTRAARKLLEASQTTDLEATANLETTTAYTSIPRDLNMEADGKMYHCSTCKQKFNNAFFTNFCLGKNIVKCIHTKMFEEVLAHMYSVALFDLFEKYVN